MALTLVTNPVGSAVSKFFAGFQKCEVVFKREDLAIVDVESGSGGIQINVTTDLTSYLSQGDVIYVYSEGANYTYNGTGTILGITATDITIDMPFIEVASGGYINYKKNYYVELQCVDKDFADSNLLPFTLQSDGDAAGNIRIDVSIVNELNTQRGVISEQLISESVTEFEIQYREVYTGSSNPYTLVDGKLFIMLYAIDEPSETEVLNGLDEPLIFLGYPAAIVIALKSLAAASTIEMTYKELDQNKIEIDSGTLGSQAADVNGFLSWLWESSASVNEQTRYIEFATAAESFFDFADPDFAYPDFLTQ